MDIVAYIERLQVEDAGGRLAVGDQHALRFELRPEALQDVNLPFTPSVQFDGDTCVFTGRVVAAVQTPVEGARERGFGSTVVDAAGLRFFVDGLHEAGGLAGLGKLWCDEYRFEGRGDQVEHRTVVEGYRDLGDAFLLHLDVKFREEG